jgi:hypothetical protein
MTRRPLQCPSPRFSAGPSAVACALFLSIVFAAHAQQPPPAPNAPPAAQAPQAPPAQTAPRQQEGFFDALGRWWDKSMSDFKSNVDEQNAKWRELGEKTNQAAKEAGDALVKIPNTRMVEGRQRCEISANGSPDCNAAAEALCRGKGFGAGKSLDIQSARKCSARSWLSGNPQESDCTTETIVTKAACQ